jgi:hypothetical protein
MGGKSVCHQGLLAAFRTIAKNHAAFWCLCSFRERSAPSQIRRMSSRQTSEKMRFFENALIWVKFRWHEAQGVQRQISGQNPVSESRMAPLSPFEKRQNNGPHRGLVSGQRRASGGGNGIEKALSRVRGRIAAKFAISARSFSLLFMYQRGNFRLSSRRLEAPRMPWYCCSRFIKTGQERVPNHHVRTHWSCG